MMDMALGPFRFIRPLLLAGLIAFAMFWALKLAISGRASVMNLESLNTVDMIRLKRDSMVEQIQRKKPEKPPPPKTPPPPELKVQSDVKPQTTPLPINIPNLNLAANITGGPFLGNFSAAGPITGDAELIPLVRIAPQYPTKALRDGIEGEVTLEITVGPDGSVKDASVKSAKPRGYFESVAVAAAFKARFRPKVVDGKPQQTTGTYTVKFALSKDQ
jgi:protein TonB